MTGQCVEDTGVAGDQRGAGVAGLLVVETGGVELVGGHAGQGDQGGVDGIETAAVAQRGECLVESSENPAGSPAFRRHPGQPALITGHLRAVCMQFVTAI